MDTEKIFFRTPRRSESVPSVGPSTATIAVEMLVAYAHQARYSESDTPAPAAIVLKKMGSSVETSRVNAELPTS